MEKIPEIGLAGDPEGRLIKRWEEFGGTFPPRPIYSEQGQITHWLRYIGSGANAKKVARLENPQAYFENLPIDDYGTTQKPSNLGVMEQYGIAVAPHRELVHTENGSAYFIQLTDHINGTPMIKYLSAEDVTNDAKFSLFNKLHQQLSAYARDTTLAVVSGQELGAIQYDLASFDQYVVENGTGRAILIDTEALSIGPQYISWGCYKFYEVMLSSFRKACYVTPNVALQLHSDFTSVEPYLGVPIDGRNEERYDLVNMVKKGFTALLAENIDVSYGRRRLKFQDW